MTIVMPDLNIGNFASVIRMVAKAGGTARLAREPDELRAADKVILAGVGAFDAGMGAIADAGWADALNEAAIHRKIPVLGICLGMQLMCRSSDEGARAGLGWFDADVVRFDVSDSPHLKIPHMGWNTVTVQRENPLLERGDPAQRFYFVHSYHVRHAPAAHVIATARHGDDFVAVLGRDNLFGAQFHPEKSHRFGLSFLKHFVEL